MRCLAVTQIIPAFRFFAVVAVSRIIPDSLRKPFGMTRCFRDRTSFARLFNVRFSMVASFWSVVSQLVAAICLAQISSPTAPTDERMGTNEAESTFTQDVSLNRRVADHELPCFSTETNSFLPSYPVSQTLDMEVLSDAQGDSPKHDHDEEVLGFGKTRDDDRAIADKETINDGEVFNSLDYAMLTIQYTFSSDADFPILIFCQNGEQTSEGYFKSQTQALSENIVVMPQKTDVAEHPYAEPVVSRSLEDIINRPMSAIRLGAARVPVTADGESLKTPLGISEHQNARIIENHYIAIPWTIARPPIFTYPIKYQPLYFEDPNLERCGATYGCLTEFSSIAHMGIRIPLLPYLMASDSPHECVRALPDCPTCCRFGMDAYVAEATASSDRVRRTLR